MTEDLRVRITRQMIIDSFVDLLEEKPLEKITVVDICSRANINRTTFYRYYYNPIDLHDKLEEWFYDEVRELSTMTIHSNASYEQLFSALLKLLTFYKENRRLLFAIESRHGQEAFSNRILHNTFNIMASSSELLYPQLTMSKNRWLFDYMGFGSSAMIYAWMSGGMKEPIEEVASFLADCTLGLNEIILG